MLDARVYRAAFLPAFLLLFVAAFSLENRPAPAGTDLAPEAFSVARAHGAGPAEPPRNSLLELARTFPERPPGSASDAALADRVAAELSQDGRFSVRRISHEADVGDAKATLETVVGVRPGVSTRRIVVLAPRDAAGSGAAAALSGTATLLELARIAELRDLQRTLVIVSTSGGTAGSAGARAWARSLGDPDSVDAVLVLGDVAGRRSERPWVIPWSNDGAPAPVALRRTVETAVRVETAEDPGSARALIQWARRALPLTPGEQGELLAAGLPAVSLQVSGEGGPRPDAPVGRQRMDAMGRGALRAITALDEAPVPRTEGGQEAAAFTAGSDGVVVLRKVLPTWAVRLLVLALLLPAALVALDGAVRLRARGMPVLRWIPWAAAAAVPLLAAWAWLRALDLVGLLDAPRGPATAADIALGAGGVLAMGSALVVALAAAVAVTRIVPRATGAQGPPGLPAAVAIGALTCALCAILTLTNPYAAALLLPAAHLWALAPMSGRPRWLVTGAVAAGALLPGLVVVVYGEQLDMGVTGLAWTLTLAAAGGAFELGTAVALSLFAGLLVRLVVLSARRRPPGAVAARAGSPATALRTAPLPVDRAGPALRG